MLFSESYQIPTSSKILSYAGKLRAAEAFPDCMPTRLKISAASLSEFTYQLLYLSKQTKGIGSPCFTFCCSTD
jgi:hypothetical protein